jgi:VIT1/CCC1 family predicted Fe2+/Mn2+ transporter
MTGGAIISAIIIALILLGGLGFCLSRLGKGSKWED